MSEAQQKALAVVGLQLEDAFELLATSRPAFLRHLKDAGIKSLPERQRLANDLGRARRQGGQEPKAAGALPCCVAFVTYGDERYAFQRTRLAEQASRSGRFDSITAASRADALRLAAGFPGALEVLNRERGGGYW